MLSPCLKHVALHVVHVCADQLVFDSSLIPRPSLPPVFDRLQYAKMEHTASDQNLEAGKAWERG